MHSASDRKSYDTIIVGAGSAGCVLAARLSENPNHQVLLLEAGGSDWHPFIRMPAGLARLATLKSVNWAYETEPEAQLNNRKLFWPRGKVLGGSSSINAMCYCRGHRKDYEEWSRAGCHGWSFDEVLPWFKHSEDFEHGADAFHGSDGPLKVQSRRYTNPLSKTFLEAAKQAGFDTTDDFNGPHQRGFGDYHVTQNNGRRWSSANAYLDPALKRPNLTVVMHAQAQSVMLDGLTATGVHALVKNKPVVFEGGRVILSGGAINSPQLLMLSGIGPAAHLSECGIQSAHELPGVGQNLQDHLDICTLNNINKPISYDQINEAMTGLRYLFTRGGPASSNIAEAGGFVVSRYAQDDRPDIQMHFVPALLDDHGRNRLPGSGMTLHACQLRPESRGEIRLASNDPGLAPKIFARYLSTETDRKMMIECAKISRKIFQQPAFADIRAEEVFPGSAVQDDAEILEFIRRKAESIYHPIGTCKMGNDEMAVVDPKLNVRGMQGLMVVDASVMPSLVSGNTNAPTIMIAEKAAAMMTTRD